MGFLGFVFLIVVVVCLGIGAWLITLKNNQNHEVDTNQKIRLVMNVHKQISNRINQTAVS